MFSLRPSFALRLTVCLLAALQGVAVSWHVCELGGSPAGAAHCHVRPAAQQCPHDADPTRAWRMTFDGAPADSAGHCLAALLSTTPAQTAPGFTFAAVFAARELPSLEAPQGVSRFAASGIDARGPPSFS